MTDTRTFYIAMVYNKSEKSINYIHVFEEYLVAEIDTIVNLFGEGGAGNDDYVGAILGENREPLVCITLPEMSGPITHVPVEVAMVPSKDSINKALANHVMEQILDLLDTNDEEIRFS